MMDGQRANAVFWRQLVASVVPPPPAGSTQDEYYYQWAADKYIKARASEHEIGSSDALDLFVAAVMLLTFGRLDVASDVIKYGLGPKTQMRSLERSAYTLIPFPMGGKERYDPDAAIAWIEANRERLYWDETEGLFMLKE